MPRLDPEFQELEAAKSWKLTPAEWRAQSVDDRALMMSFVMFKATCETYRWHYREANRKGKSGGAPNAYAEMKRQMKL